jgi:hypothetical protein
MRWPPFSVSSSYLQDCCWKTWHRAVSAVLNKLAFFRSLRETQFCKQPGGLSDQTPALSAKQGTKMSPNYPAAAYFLISCATT